MCVRRITVLAITLATAAPFVSASNASSRGETALDDLVQVISDLGRYRALVEDRVRMMKATGVGTPGFAENKARYDAAMQAVNDYYLQMLGAVLSPSLKARASAADLATNANAAVLAFVSAPSPKGIAKSADRTLIGAIPPFVRLAMALLSIPRSRKFNESQASNVLSHVQWRAWDDIR